MKKFTFWVLFLVAFSHAAANPKPQPNGSVNIPKRAVNGSGILQLPLTKVNGTSATKKRQTGLPLNNPSNGYTYLVTIGFGTPSQQITLQVDTGSSEIWVNPECLGAWRETFCETYPQYYPASSSTSSETTTEAFISYMMDRWITLDGYYYLDNLVLGGHTILQQKFGVCYASAWLDTPLLGIGFGNDFVTNYNNFIDQLYLQGITQSRAFSVDLGSVDSSAGSIIFGGIDTTKFSGPLVKNSIILWSDMPDLTQRYYLDLASVGMTNNYGSITWTASGFQEPVVLDTGRTFSYLPQTLVTSMLTGFVGIVSQGSGRYTISCSYLGDTTTTVDFGFGGITIKVPIHQFIYNDGTLCWFGAVGQAAGSLSYLGDTFLRAAYVVYDQGNLNIWLAQAASCSLTHVIAIGSGSGAVASTTGACTTPVTSTTTLTTSTPTTFTTSTLKTATTSSATPQTIYITVTTILTLPATTVTVSGGISVTTLTIPSATTTVFQGTTATVAKTTTTKITTKTEKDTTTMTKTVTTTKACKT